MSVFVLDKRGNPLMPCSEKRARLMLERGRARVHRLYPFTIRLVDRLQEDSELQDVSIKIDPGSKTTGLAVIRQEGKDVHILHLANLTHRGATIRDNLQGRSACRRRRRGNLRYRAARFLNRGNKKKDWLAPSLMHRVNTALSWVRRYRRLAPITGIAVERVKFDTQKLECPDISGAEYQQGTLAGYTIREYLLERDGRKCAYCGKEKVPLEIEHIVPRSRGGSNRLSNLTLACRTCNEKKGSQTIEVFLKGQPEVLRRVKANMRRSLADAAAVNATRERLFLDLLRTGLPVETGSGDQTKFNRVRLGIEKDHCLDAACVGAIDQVFGADKPVLHIKCTGRGQYQRTKPDRFGFPRLRLTRQKLQKGFQTGDMVKAMVPKGKKAGIHIGRVAVRSSGSFNVGKVQGVHWKYCRIIQRADGYDYSTKIAQPNEEARKAA